MVGAGSGTGSASEGEVGVTAEDWVAAVPGAGSVANDGDAKVTDARNAQGADLEAERITSCEDISFARVPVPGDSGVRI